MPAKPWVESPEVSADDLVRMAEDRLLYPDGSPIYANFTVGFDAAEPGSDRTAYTFYGGGRRGGKNAESWRRMNEWVKANGDALRSEGGETRHIKDITAIATVRRV